MSLKLPCVPTTTTHVLLHDYGSKSNGVFIIHAEFFKKSDEGVWLKYETDTDNEYPGWVQAERLYRNGTFQNVITLLQPI